MPKPKVLHLLCEHSNPPYPGVKFNVESAPSGRYVFSFATHLPASNPSQ